AADILEALDEERAADLLIGLEPDDAGEVLDEMRPEAAADILEEMEPGSAATLVAAMEPDQAADVLAALEPEDRTAVLAELDEQAAAEIGQLMVYEPDTAGGVMTTDVAALPMGVTTDEAINRLRQLHDDLGSNLSYVYVVDDDFILQGVVSFRDLVFSRPGRGLDQVMVPDPVAVTAATDREEVAELIQRYHLLAIPVVDDDWKLIGMVKFGEAIEAIQAEVGEDIAVMVGAGEEETISTPVMRSVSRRLPWIVFNLFAGFVTAQLIFRFEGTIETYAVLAAYMPIVSALGGNTGAQSQAIIIRSIATGDLPTGRAWRAIRRQLAIAVTQAALVAVIAALLAASTVAFFGQDTTVSPGEMAIIVVLSMMIALTVAGGVGSGIPILMRWIGLDPALASSIFMTMITDIVGFTGFLLIATLLLA
ncbi:MAG: magnesium transporter, partial [Actinobacteria bacterium]